MTELMPGIKQISQTGNDMYIQGAFPVSIVTTDAAQLADSADTHLLASRDSVIKEISVGMTGNEIKEEYVTGAPPLTLSDSEGYPLQWWQVTLSPYQEGTGDPAPDNVRPIHGTDKLTVWTAGSNLYDVSTCTPNYYISASGVITANSTSMYSDLIPVATGNYYFSLKNVDIVGRTIRVHGYDSNGDWVEQITTFNVNANITNGTVVVVRAEIKYVRVSVPKTSENGMFNGGNTAKPYTPYIAPSSSVITLPETIYSGQVYAGGVVSSTTEIDMGAQDWIYHSEHDVFYYLTPDGKPTGTGQSGYGMCEEYKVMEGTYYTALTDGQMAVGTNFVSAATASVVVKDARFTDAAQFKAAVSGVKLVYELATPTLPTLSTPSIPTPKGNVTTWAAAEDGVVDSMEVTYIKSK